MRFAPLFLLLSREFCWTPAEILDTGCMMISMYLDEMTPKKSKEGSKALDFLIKMIPRA